MNNDLWFWEANLIFFGVLTLGAIFGFLISMR